MLIWAAIHPRQVETRILVTTGDSHTNGVLVADAAASRSGTNLFADTFAVYAPTPLFELEVVEARLRQVRRTIAGVGDFRDLRQMLLWGVDR